MNQGKGENDSRKNLMISFHERLLLDLAGTTSRMLIGLCHHGWHPRLEALLEAELFSPENNYQFAKKNITNLPSAENFTQSAKH